MITKQFSREDIAALTVNHLSEYPPLESIITIDRSIYAIKGGLSMVTGKTGSGKTTILRIMISLALMESHPPKWFDNLNIAVTPAHGKPVIYVNTEMPNASLKKRMHDTILHDLQLKETPANFYIIQALDLSIDDRKNLIKSVIECFKDIHLLVIDGGADTVLSVNDETKSVEAIEELNQLANQYRTTIVNVVHENRGNGLTRGHYGQHCERKSTGIISIKYESAKKHFSITPVKIRESADFSPIHFAYNQNGDIYQLDAPTASQMEREAKSNELLDLVIRGFRLKETWKSSEFKKWVADQTKMSPKTGGRRVDEMFLANYITTDEPGFIKCLVPLEQEADEQCF